MNRNYEEILFKKINVIRLSQFRNTVSHEILYLNEIHEVLRFLKLSPLDIDGMQPGGKRWEIRVKSMQIWQDKCLDGIFGAYLPLASGKRVLITKAYEELNEIIVKKVPMSWEDSRLIKIFSWYGDFRNVKVELWRSNRNFEFSDIYQGIHNGAHKITLKLKKSIPSILTIDGTRLEVHYENQELSCWRSGGPHYKSQCKTKWGNFTNRFEMKDFETEGDNSDEAN